jgi:hypothetical protein
VVVIQCSFTALKASYWSTLSFIPLSYLGRMADEHAKPAKLVTHYLQARGPALAGMHDVWAVETSFNASKSQYEAKKKHE